MNLGAIRTAIERRSGVAADATALNGFINEAVQQISVDRNWYWLDGVSSYTANSAYTALPTDWAETRSVAINSEEAERVNVADFDSFDSNYWGGADRYYLYAIEGGNLYILPEPTSTSTVSVVHRYVKAEPALTGDTDTPLMPAAYHSVVCDLATALVLERTHPDRAAYYRKTFEDGLARMIKGARRGQNPGQIRVRLGAWY